MELFGEGGSMSFSGAADSADYPRVVALTLTDQTLASGEFAPLEINPDPTADIEPRPALFDIGVLVVKTDSGVVQIETGDLGTEEATTVFRGQGQTYTFELGDPSDQELIAEACDR